MSMNIEKKMILRLFLYGFLVWLIPFVISFGFYDKSGELAVDILLFKSVMVLVGSTNGTFWIVKFLKESGQNYIQNGLLAGFVFLIMSVLLDLATIIAMFGMTLEEFAAQILIIYLAIPVLGYIIGAGFKSVTSK